MRIRHLPAIIACFLGFVSSTPAADRTAVPASESECLAHNGHWGGLGLRPSGVCVLTTNDAGKKCTDASQCEGVCVAPAGAKRGARVVGTCSSERPVAGALTLVVKGRVTIIIAE